MALNVVLQPKQSALLDALEATGDAPTILGFGGSRGSAKSGGARRCAIILCQKYPGIVVYLIRRVMDDVKENHLQKIELEFPAVAKLWHEREKAYIFPNGSRLKLLSAEHAADVKRISYGPESTFLIIDQAEQFSEDELLSFRICNRFSANEVLKSVPKNFCKTLLLFNTGVGIGAAYLRRIFHTKSYDLEREDPKDYWFMHAFGWDNFEWFRGQVPYTFKEFYQLSSQDRFALYVTQTSEGKKMNALPKHRRDGEMLGNFDAFSGQYFSTVWGEHCVIPQAVANELVQNWWTKWMAQRWGFNDHAYHCWLTSGWITPGQWERYFGGTVSESVEVMILYREMLTIGIAEAELADTIIEMTPQAERSQIQEFRLGHESLRTERKRGANTIEDVFRAALQGSGLPTPIQADGERIDGWRHMFNCIRQAGMIQATALDRAWTRKGPMLLIADSCKAAIENLPLAARDEKEPNDVEHKIGIAAWVAVCDAIRYGLKSKLAAKGVAPYEVRRQAACDAYEDPTAKHMAILQFQQRERSKGREIRTRHLPRATFS